LDFDGSCYSFITTSHLDITILALSLELPGGRGECGSRKTSVTLVILQDSKTTQKIEDRCIIIGPKCLIYNAVSTAVIVYHEKWEDNAKRKSERT
jgi:hypothetical protein